MSRAFQLTAVAALCLLVGAVYAPGLGGGYAFDDFANIVDNAALRVASPSWAHWMAAAFSSPASDLQRPLAMLTFALNIYWGDLAVAPMKGVNILIHVFNVVLVLVLVRRILQSWKERHASDLSPARRDAAAFAVAALWGFAPINLMAVLFVVQRMESLSHTFVFLGLLSYLKLRELRWHGGGRLAAISLSIAAFSAVGTLVKESAALLPLYAFFLEVFIFCFRSSDRGRDRGLVIFYLVFLAIPALAGGSWLLGNALADGAYSGRPYTLAERLFTELHVLCDYLHWIVIPDIGAMSLYHDDYPISHGLLNPPTTLLALVGLVLAVGVAVVLRKRRPLLALGIAFFFAAHVLTATVVPLELVYEHRNYFASLGIYLALADVLLVNPVSARWIGTAVYSTLVVIAAGATHLRAREWSNPLRFDVSEAAKHPQSARATYALARTYVLLSAYDPSSPFVDKAVGVLEQCRRIPNASLLPEQALLVLAARTNRPLDPAWWESARKKLESRPVGVQDLVAVASLVNCANVRECKFPKADMLTLLGALLAATSESADALTTYANYALNSLGDADLALRLFEDAWKKAPGVAIYRINIAKVLIAAGQYSAAEEHIAALLRMNRLGQYTSDIASLYERIASQKKLLHPETPPPLPAPG